VPLLEDESFDGRHRRFERAARRLRVLGLSRRRAVAFGGEAVGESAEIVDRIVFGDDRGRER
jgi:hypothetical protein